MRVLMRPVRSHVLSADKNTLVVFRDNSFWGCGSSGIPNTFTGLVEENLKSTRKPYFSMIVDVMGIRVGDVAFMYEKDVGFHGVFKITGRPFFDSTPVGTVDESLPIRIDLEYQDYFPVPVPEDYLFSTKEYETKSWGWFYNTIHGPRGVTTVNPECAEALIELLVKINGSAVPSKPAHIKPYVSKNKTDLVLPLGKDDKVYSEDTMRAWLIHNIDNSNKRDLREIFGPVEDLEWFANNVPYYVTRRNNMDILCYHNSTRYTGLRLRYKFSVVELRRDTANADDVSQVINYSKWVAGRLADGEVEIVQPILIAHDFNDDAVLKAKNSDFNDRGIMFIKYSVEANDMKFERVI